jgi:hypothetical protein
MPILRIIKRQMSPSQYDTTTAELASTGRIRSG